MPRIHGFRLLGLWVAYTLDDYGQAGYIRLGLTENHARTRTLRAS